MLCNDGRSFLVRARCASPDASRNLARYNDLMCASCLCVFYVLLKCLSLFPGLYLTSKTVHKLEVDTSRGERITINVRSLVDPKRRYRTILGVLSFPENVYPGGCEGKAVLQLDITLPRMPCDWVSVDAVDASGRVQSAIEHEVFRQRLSARGRKVQGTELHEVGPKNGTLPEHLKPDAVKLPDDYCGSCYGAEEQEGDCCNTCEVVRVKYQKKGWVMPEYDTIEQCKREGYQDNMARMVRRHAHISHLCMLIVDH